MVSVSRKSVIGGLAVAVAFVTFVLTYTAEVPAARRRAERAIGETGVDAFRAVSVALLEKFRPPGSRAALSAIQEVHSVNVPETEWPLAIKLLRPLGVAAEHAGLYISLVLGPVGEEGILVTPEPIDLSTFRDPTAPQEIYKNIYWYHITIG